MQQQTTEGFHLSPQQRLLWQSDALQRAQLAILIEGPLDAGRLDGAVRELVARHEILRTTYARSAGMKAPFQVVNQDASEMQHQLEVLGPDRYRLTIDLPAMSADAASLRNIFLELGDLYSSRHLEDPLQYADYSEWHNDFLRKAAGEASEGKDFWTARDYAAIPHLLLPFETNRRSEARETVDLGELTSAPDTLLAAWQILLWRLTGQPEIVVGRTVEGRNHEEFARALGVYTKVLPEYANFETEVSFGEVVERVRVSREQAANWEDYVPLDRPSGGMTVGFRVNAKVANQHIGGVEFSLAHSSAHCPFGLELRYTEEGSAELVYDPARFTRMSVERIAERLRLVLASAPQTPAGQVQVMDEDERQQVLADFNRTTAPYPTDKCLHQLFEEQAARTPDAPALRDEAAQLTYKELNARANQLAHALRARGVKASVPVGLLVERSADMIVGLLGILKAGGCYVPLVPDHPKARLAHQLSETRAPVVLTQEKLVHGLPDFRGEVLCLDRDRKLLDGEPSGNLPLATAPENLVYVIYTSGSTGIPKGVAVTHANLVNYSAFLCDRVGAIGAAPLQFATVSTLSADLGNTCIFPSLISGGCLHVIGFEMAMNPRSYAAYNVAHPIDILKITPSHLTMLLDGAGASVLPRKFLISGGEALTWALHQRLREAGCTVLNHYGPTEATVGCCTFGPDTDVSTWAPATVPVGRPIANDEIYILDASRQPVPIGVGGELCIGGAGVARGYLNQPEQTAERFIPHPFTNRSDARLYCTGDLARFLPTGDVEFLGRIDHQVKIRGFRVEPAEVEAALRRHPAVRQAAIVAEEDAASGEKVLVAYAAVSKTLDNAEWRAFLRQQLPEYMLPSRLVSVEALPLTANGKVDTRALSALGAAQHQTGCDFVGARNPSEEKMVRIWTEVLKVDRVGIHNNFFEMGGHSLLATQIIARIRNAFGVQLPLHSFLETPTIAHLSAKIADCPAVESEEDAMARLLQELDGISEEEAQMLLAMENDQKAG